MDQATPSLLIVDDDADFLDAAVRWFRRNGYSAIPASTVAEACDAAPDSTSMSPSSISTCPTLQDWSYSASSASSMQMWQ